MRTIAGDEIYNSDRSCTRLEAFAARAGRQNPVRCGPASIAPRRLDPTQRPSERTHKARAHRRTGVWAVVTTARGAVRSLRRRGVVRRGGREPVPRPFARRPLELAGAVGRREPSSAPVGVGRLFGPRPAPYPLRVRLPRGPVSTDGPSALRSAGGDQTGAPSVGPRGAAIPYAASVKRSGATKHAFAGKIRARRAAACGIHPPRGARGWNHRLRRAHAEAITSASRHDRTRKPQKNADSPRARAARQSRRARHARARVSSRRLVAARARPGDRDEAATPLRIRDASALPPFASPRRPGFANGLAVCRTA